MTTVRISVFHMKNWSIQVDVSEAIGRITVGQLLFGRSTADDGAAGAAKNYNLS